MDMTDVEFGRELERLARQVAARQLARQHQAEKEACLAHIREQSPDWQPTQPKQDE
jgi:hypothetical protein